MEADLNKIKTLKDPFAYLKKELSKPFDSAMQCKLSMGAYSFIQLILLLWQLSYNMRIWMQQVKDHNSNSGALNDNKFFNLCTLVLSLLPSLYQVSYQILLFLQRDDTALLKGQCFTRISLIVSTGYFVHLVVKFIFAFVFTSRGLCIASFLFMRDILL